MGHKPVSPQREITTQKISLYCELSHQGYGFWQDCVSIFPTCLDVTLLPLAVEGFSILFRQELFHV